MDHGADRHNQIFSLFFRLLDSFFFSAFFIPFLLKVFLLLPFLLPSSTPHLVSEDDEVWKKRSLKSLSLHKKLSKKGMKHTIARE